MISRHNPNKKTPDVYAVGWTTTTLTCEKCKRLIDAHSPVNIRISYNFYYDHCLFYHLLCSPPKEMHAATEAV